MPWPSPLSSAASLPWPFSWPWPLSWRSPLSSRDTAWYWLLEGVKKDRWILRIKDNNLRFASCSNESGGGDRRWLPWMWLERLGHVKKCDSLCNTLPSTCKLYVLCVFLSSCVIISACLIFVRTFLYWSTGLFCSLLCSWLYMFMHLFMLLSIRLFICFCISLHCHDNSILMLST